MNKLQYTNKPLDLDQQIALLKSRGLLISDELFAKRQIQIISYFRLATYLRPMEADKQNHRFKPRSTFNNAIDLYYFDKELRALIFTGIQSIEIAVRASIIEKVTWKYGPFWFMDSSFFVDKDIFTKCRDTIIKEVARSKEDFILEHFQKYDTPPYPPVWKSLEVISFGTLAKLYCNLSDIKVKKHIARSLGLPQHLYLESWLKSITALRNYIAHHNRIWNRQFPIRPQLPVTLKNGGWVNQFGDLFRLYSQLSCLVYLVNQIHPFNTFASDLKALLVKYPNVDVSAMGFPKDWENEPLWMQAENTVHGKGRLKT